MCWVAWRGCWGGEWGWRLLYAGGPEEVTLPWDMSGVSLAGGHRVQLGVSSAVQPRGLHTALCQTLEKGRLFVQAEWGMQVAFTVRSVRDRVKITQLAAEPSGRPHESMSRKDSPPFGEGLADGDPLPCHGVLPCLHWVLPWLTFEKIWGLRPTAWLSGLHCLAVGQRFLFCPAQLNSLLFCA